MSPPTGVLFVCLGNICRSPLAEAVFLHRAGLRGLAGRFDVDSCGTGDWHAGGPADPRSVEVALRYGIAIEHVARQLDPAQDFHRFEWIIAMDRSNRRNIIAMGETRGLSPRNVRLMRSFDPSLAGADEHELDVPDPYYGGSDGFVRVYEMITAACDGLLDRLAPGA